MNKKILILSGLLISQVLLAITLNMNNDDYAEFHSDEVLLSFEPKAVDKIRIDSTAETTVLMKTEGGWQVEKSDESPVNSSNIERLLKTLADLKKGWPVANTSSAAERFNVADDQFKLKLTLLSGETTLTTLYVGSSPGFHKVYVRAENDNKVFAVRFDTWTASAKTDDWVEKGETHRRN